MFAHVEYKYNLNVFIKFQCMAFNFYIFIYYLLP